jgi:predicted Rossmann fold flavoprotein
VSGREDRKWDLVVAGGGAAGFFAALHAKAHMPEARVLLLEKSKEWLAKVAISGGGRCNVTHHCFDPSELIRFYPRGGRELRGAFHRWQPTHTVDWFESRGVKLKTEPDGRMFPVSDDAGEIIRCLTREADRAGIDRWNLCGLQGATRTDTGFEIALTNNPPVSARCLLIATGGNRGSGGLEVAKELGHAIEEPVPSLFTFHVKHPLLEGLSGIVADPVELRIPSLDAAERGPMLITHWGLSGPAVLKLSAWQARALAAADYRAELTVNWLGDRNEAALRGDFERLRAQNGGQAIAKHPLGGLPRRLWERLVQTAGIPAQTPWTRLAAPQRLGDA